MFQVGRLCVKIAGRDARLKCVVVDILESPYVMVDGQTRRRKCNINHLEPLDNVLKIRKGASHDEIVSALKAEGIEVSEKTGKKEKPAIKEAKPKKSAKAPAEEKTAKPKKKTVKKD